MTPDDDVKTEGGITGPSQPTHEATTPPGNQEPDPEKLEQSVEELEKPGGGH